ncbi:hypothetical protein QYE76_034965 [Lolium multiflorum]|uniref:Uncharacterized protein n=1 Tax=Lolium multiflorum TaxID=4521 RepID=A0AAD8R020_LOLMU|nr:hypothetical protein QYE76_034965 [Lolium multiflorum]
MMKSNGLPGKFWGEAVNTAVYLLNRAPTRSMVGGTPYEAWYGRKPSVDHLRTFGCVAYVKTVSSHKRKLVNRSTPMIMTGYEEGSKAYRLCNPSTNKVVVTCDVVFEEDLSWIWDSTEPVHDEIFTVVCNSNSKHADDQSGARTDVLGCDGASRPVRTASTAACTRTGLRGSNSAQPSGSPAASLGAGDGPGSGARGRGSSAPGGASSGGGAAPGGSLARSGGEPTDSSSCVSPHRSLTAVRAQLKDAGQEGRMRPSITSVVRPEGRGGSVVPSGGSLQRVVLSSKEASFGDRSQQIDAWLSRETGAKECPGKESGGCNPGSALVANRLQGLPAVAQATEESVPSSSPTVLERRRLPTPEIFRNVFDLYSPEVLRITCAQGRGGGRCLLTEEPTKFEDANTEECWRRATDDEEVAKFKLHMKEIFKMYDQGLLTYYLRIEVQQKLGEITLCKEAYAKRILENCSMEDCNQTQVLMGPQLGNEGPSSDETSATSGAEEYVVLSLTALKTSRLRPTRARMRRVLNYYPKKELRTVNNPVKMKHKKKCLFIKVPVKTEDADKENCRREAMKKPTKVKLVAWVPRGAAKAMPRKTPAGSSWRIWDPGRSGVHVVLRGVIVSIKHDNTSTASWT